MTEYIEWLRILVSNHILLGYLAIFFGIILTGSFALFMLGFLVAQKMLTIFPVMIVSLLAVFLSDILWFFIEKTSFVKKIILHRYANKTISDIAFAIIKISKKSHTIALILAKLLVGTPFILIIYLSESKLKFKKFIYYNIFPTTIWVSVSIFVGYMAGLGFTYFAEVFESVHTAIGFILLIPIIAIVLQKWLADRVSSEK